MPKSAILKRTDETPPVRNGEFVATSTVLQISQLAMTSPFVGDFQIIGQGRLIVGEHPDLGERFIVTSGGAFAFNAAGTRTFAVWTRGDGVHTGGDVYLGHPDNFLMYDQSEGTLGLYTAAGAGFIADSDGSLFAGDSDGAHMRWSSASRALEIRNGEDVKISLDANGDGLFDGMVYASGGRIYGQMQVDGLFRAGDVDGPSVSLGRFERVQGSTLVESAEIIATDANNMPWFHVVAGGGTAGGGWFQVGNPGDYQQRLIYDGARLVLDGDIYARGGEFAGDVVFGGGAGALGPNGLSIVSDGDATPETTNAVAWYDEASFTNRTGWIYGQTGITEHNLTIETDGRVLDYTATTYLYARGGASKTGAVRMYAYGNDTDSNGGNIGIAATGAAGGATATVNADAVQITGNGYWKPASDSTTALQMQNAAGQAVVTVDTTNSMVGIGTTAPGAKLEVSPVINTSDGSSCIQSIFRNNGTGDIIGLRLLPQSWHSSGTRSKAVAIETGIWQVDGGSISDAICIDVTGLSLFAGVVGNLYGLRIKGISGGSGTNYAIHADSGLNYLAGAVGVGIEEPTALIHGLLTSAATNTVSNVLTIGHNTSGTVDNGFGAGQAFTLATSTTADQSAARIQALWNDATHATRKADLVLTAYDTSEREGLRIRGNGSAPAIGFLGATPAARRAHVADPSGGATVDAEARTAINSILATLETFGFHATS